MLELGTSGSVGGEGGNLLVYPADAQAQEVMREVIAGRIIAAARLGERDPARLLEAALCKPE